ncbi:MAG: hypothetical protein ABII26_07080 [Pseudomonadota bacterium]
MHEAISRRLRERPELLDLARENIDRWIEVSGETPAWRFWKRILGQPLDTIIKILVSPDERSRELRQSSPFCGILSQKERWRIYEDFSPGAYYKSRR